MAHPLILKIGTGIVRGLPLIRTIRDLIKPPLKPGLAEIEGKPVEANVMTPRPGATEIIMELLTVGLIVAFVFGKITMQDLQTLFGLIK